MPITLLYVTAPDMDCAKTIARTLLDERLIACANLVGQATSLYRWDGAVREEQEALLIAKTTENQSEAAISRIRSLHPYDCPCILALPVTGGHGPFLKWVDGEVS